MKKTKNNFAGRANKRVKAFWPIVLLFHVTIGIVLGLFTTSGTAAPDRISVAYCIDCVPFHFQDENGKADGMIIDLWRLWSEKTGITIDYIPATWGETLKMVGEGVADAHAGLFYNEQRDAFLEYGASLTETDTHYFVSKGLTNVKTMEDLAGHEVGVLSGDYVEGYLESRLPEGTVIGFDSYETIMAALKEGRLKAFAADTPTGLYHLQKSGLGFEFEFPVENPLYQSTWFAAVTEGNRELISIINSGMAKITSKEKSDIRHKWSTAEFETGIDPKLVIQIGGAAATALIVILIWNRSLQSEVRQRKRAEDALKAADALLTDAIENISDAFVLYDSDDRVVTCNRKFRDLYGYSEEYIATRPTWTDLETIDTEHNIIEWETNWEETRGIRRWDDFERRLTNGLWLDIRQRKTETGGTVSIQVDVTDRKQAERMMEEAKEQAERVAEAKSEFVAVISHEVRTPMNGVLGMARLLQQTNLNEDQRENVDTIVASGDALVSIVNDLLDVSKLEAGRLELEAIPFIPSDTVMQSVSVMFSRAEEKGLKLERDIDENFPDVLIGDPFRLRQIILNLLSNAIKFTARGHIHLTARLESLADNTANIRISVSDTGQGITPEAQENLFSAYTQGTVDVARKYGGTGLGLSICRHLANLMGGKISFDSTYGEGSTFHFTAPFPIDLETDPEALRQHNKRRTFGGARIMKPLRILQAEDVATNRDVVIKILKPHGHEIINVEHGRAALAAIESSRFDLILMDRHMPVMSGTEATQRIRSMNSDTANIPIIGITAGATQKELDECIAAGMNACLSKPIDPETLLDVVSHYGSDLARKGDVIVLVVDDTKLNRDVAKKQFSNLGVACETAESGEQALELLDNRDYAAIFTDILMPGMDGMELAEHIRNREKELNRHTPIIAVTGRVDPEEQARYRSAGIDDVIGKPVTSEALAEILGIPKMLLKTASALTYSEIHAPIDLGKLAAILGDDDDREIDISLNMFIDTFPALLETLEQAATSQDRLATRNAAHAAKSAANYAAAFPLVRLLVELEETAGDAEWQTMENSISHVRDAYANVVTFCEQRNSGDA